jgi:hypothetical protein
MAVKVPKSEFCPLKDAIRRLKDTIQDLQQKNHPIFPNVGCEPITGRMLQGIEPYWIEWLILQRGIDDLFVQLMARWPNSTTITPNRDIDFVLTYGINVSNLSTMAPNIPVHFDHLGIVLDLYLGVYFLLGKHHDKKTYVRALD